MSKHLKPGDAKPDFSPKNKFRVYSMLFCPYAQRVRLVIAAKAINHCDIVNIRLRNEKPEWFAAINPLGQVPVLEFPNGDVICESLIISDLLDELYPENPLRPSDPLVKARQKMFVDHFGKGFIASFYKYARERTEENKETLSANLSKCEKYLENGKLNFFGGDQPGMVDYMIWPFFERLPNLYDLSSEIHPNVNNWFNKMRSIPAVEKESLSPDLYKKFYEGYFKGQPEYDLL